MSITENTKFDYDGYTKSLEKVLEGVTKDYWASYIDINRHQVNVGRTYLWVSAALVGIYTAGYGYFNLDKADHPLLMIFGALSYLLAFIAFGICLYAIPAREGYKTIPLKGWGEFSHHAYGLLSNKSQPVYPTFLSHLISKVDYAFEFNFKTNQRRARLLRITSWLLIASFFVALVTSIGALATTQKSVTKEISKMSDETQADSQPSDTNSGQQESPAVPVPPPPADIGGTIHTHTEDSPINRQSFTDGTDKK